MITNLLSKDKCAQCQICCKYSEESRWDAPGFTKSELTYALSKKELPFCEKNGLSYFDLIKVGENEYWCQMADSGCILKKQKPFKCAIWPFYVVEREGEFAIMLSDICPELRNSGIDYLKSGIDEIKDDIRRTIAEHPELVEINRPHFRFIMYL